MQSLRLSRRWPPPGWASVPAQHHHDVLQVVLDAEQEMVPVGDHGHPRRQVPGHAVGRHPHPSLIKSRAKSFLTICSQVVMAILMALSITGLIHSWTDFSMASFSYDNNDHMQI